MPTSSPRHAITETADVAAYLDLAAERWPTAGRAELIRPCPCGLGGDASTRGRSPATGRVDAAVERRVRPRHRLVRMIAADASRIIALRDPFDAFHTAAVKSADETIEADIVLHEVTLAECLVGPARLGDAGRAETDRREAYTVDANTAVIHRASAIATFDRRLRTWAAAGGLAVPTVSG